MTNGHRWFSLFEMSGSEGAAIAANAMQAEYFKGFLEHERSESATRLAALTRRLTECMPTGDRSHISHLRAVIRAAENELRGIERMVERLRERFPEEAQAQQRA